MTITGENLRVHRRVPCDGLGLRLDDAADDAARMIEIDGAGLPAGRDRSIERRPGVMGEEIVRNPQRESTRCKPRFGQLFGVRDERRFQLGPAARVEDRLAALERRLSEPPRRIAALPDFRHSAPASAVTLGRLS